MAVVTWTPSALAVMWPVYRPVASSAGSTVTPTVAVPFAGTVTVSAFRAAPGRDEATFNSTALSVVLV